MEDRYLSLEDLRGPPFNIRQHRDTIREWVKKGLFPQPVKLGAGDNKYARLGFLESEVLACLGERKNNRKVYEAPPKTKKKAA
jgi:predicted DNA-binding transcriptional regulator AlpA